MERKSQTRTEDRIEVSEKEMREFLGLKDNEACYTITGSGPFTCYLMTFNKKEK
jgi:hypothetical protein